MPGGKKYLDLIKKGISAKKGVESQCTVWCVSDVDADPNNHAATNEQLKEYDKQARDNDFNIALSNPCFELWYLLHFNYSSSPLTDNKAVVKKLDKKGRLLGYAKNKDYYSLLVDKMDTAINNAKKLKMYHVKQNVTDYLNASVNPNTNVYELVNLIR